MGRGQEQYVHPFFPQRLPGKRFQRIPTIAAKVRIELVQLRGMGAFTLAGKESRLLDLWMAQKQPRQLKPGVTRGANDGGLNGCWHQARSASSRSCSSLASLLSAVMISRVSSPAT